MSAVSREREGLEGSFPSRSPGTARLRAVPLDRSERLRQIRAGLAAGLTHQQIANVLGISRSAVRNVINDPDGSKQRARRERYVGECVDCGGETRSNGTKKPSARCPACAQAASIKWDAATVAAALRVWQEKYGRQPTVMDFSPALALDAARRVKKDRRARYLEAAERYRADACWPSATTILSVFGTFGAALDAAGMRPNPKSPRWSRERILERIGTWSTEHGQPPMQKDWLGGSGSDWPSSSTVIYYFGSFAAGLQAAGCDVEGPRERRAWSDEQIVGLIRAYVSEHGHLPKAMEWARASDDRPSAETIIRRFGSWRAAVETAGFVYSRSKYTRDSIAASFRRWRDEHGQWPLNKDWFHVGPYWPSQATVYGFFKTWADAIEYAEQTNEDAA